MIAETTVPTLAMSSPRLEGPVPAGFCNAFAVAPGNLLDFDAQQFWSGIALGSKLFDIGIAQKDALILVADIWRSVSIKPETPSHEIRELNQQTLKKLDSTGILRKQPAHIYGSIIDDWQFPLYDLDLKLIPVDINTLRERQDSWNPD